MPWQRLKQGETKSHRNHLGFSMVRVAQAEDNDDANHAKKGRHAEYQLRYAFNRVGLETSSSLERKNVSNYNRLESTRDLLTDQPSVVEKLRRSNASGMTSRLSTLTAS